jgi:hypothetical protein
MSRLLLLVAGLLAANLPAQATKEAADVIAKSRAALAKDAAALAAVRNLHFSGKVVDKDGQTTQSFILEVAQGGKRREFRYDKEYTVEISTVTNGLEAWVRRTNLTTNQAEAARVLPFEVAVNLREMGKADLGFYALPEGAKAEVARKGEKVEGKDVVSVTYRHAGTYTYTRHFDARDFTLVATDYPRPDGKLERQVEAESQQVDGIRFPKSVKVLDDKGELLGTLVFDKISVNGDLAPNAFDFPVR